MVARAHLLRILLAGVPLAAACTEPAAQSVALNASGGALIPEQAGFDVQHYALALEVDPEAQRISGTLAMRARAVAPLGRIALDLDQRLKVRAVRRGGEAAKHRHADGRLWIELEEPLQVGAEFRIEVEYGGRPRVAPNPPWEGGFTWARSADGRPWIATSCQGEGADLWWPCKDHPSDKPESMDIDVTVPNGLVCASNGVLREVVSPREGWQTWRWHTGQPISNYNVALNIGPYELLEEEFESVDGTRFPVRFWVLPEDAGRGRAFLPEILAHLRFFEELLGPYPFRAEKYGVVQTPHLGMEHQTIIAYGNQFRSDPDGYDWLHHHELAHEWWANLVTCADWKDMWLHEGFGTYMQALYIERMHGAERMRAWLKERRDRLHHRRPVAPRETRNSKEIYFSAAGEYDNDIYEKGAWVLHTLRWVLGEERFFEVLRRMAYPDAAHLAATDGSQVRFADTEDFRALAEDVAGEDLAWFFEVYLRQPALPRLRVSRSEESVEFRWQAPAGMAFPMPLSVQVGGRLQRLAMPGGAATLSLAPGQEFAVDPHAWILHAPQ